MADTLRVLYVDDEPGLLEIGKHFLEASGDFTVTKALNAPDAIHLLEVEKFDAIISDYQMPGMDGIEFLVEVRTRFGPIPFILFTGRGREEVVIQAINSGADFYLQKGGQPAAQFAELSHKVKAAASRKRAEDLLRTSEERYREFFTTSRDSVFITSPEGRWIDFNDALLEMFGYKSRVEMFETPVESIYANPEEPPVFFALIERDGYVKEYPMRLKQRDGTVIDTLLTAVPARNPDGSVKAFIGTIRDVTRLKQVEKEAKRSHEELSASYEQIAATEEELRQTLDQLTEQERDLRESEEKYRTVFENTGTATVVIEENRIISLANNGFVQLSGFSKDDIEGKKSWTDFVAREDLERMLEQHRLRRLNQETALPHYEFRFITKSGDIRTIFLSIDVIPGTKKTIASLLDITERKRADEFIRLLAELSDNAPASITVHDFEGNFLYANNETFRLHGYSREEFLAKNVHDIDVPESEKLIAERIQRIRDIGEGEFDVQHFRKDGSIFPLHVNGKIIEWGGRNVMLSIAVDRTERKRAEETLAESRRQLDAMANNIPGVVYRFSVRPDGTYGFDYISERSRQILGIENDPATFFDRIILGSDPENRDRFISSVQHAITTKTLWEFEGPFVKPTGEKIWLSAVSSPVMEHGKLFFDGVIFDITDRKRAERELHDATLNWQKTFDSTQDAICLFDADQRIITCNRTMREVLGLKNEDALIGRHCWEVVHGTAGPVSGCPYHRMQGSLKREKMELEIGDRRFVVVADPILDGTRHLVGAVHSIRDITERRRAEEAIRQANRKLTLLTGIIRHDINNQLLALDGFLDLLRMNAPDPALEDYFNKITKASSRISAMIRFTKEYEQIGINEPTWQECHTLIDNTAIQAPLGNVRVKNDFPCGTEVFADPLLSQVFYNLMENAVQYGGKITIIRFSILKSGDALIIVCEDDGEGIPAGDKEKIFEHGFGKNTGLGLFLAREILGITGITIHETGEPGKGARFEMTVPKGMWRF